MGKMKMRPFKKSITRSRRALRDIPRCLQTATGVCLIGLAPQLGQAQPYALAIENKHALNTISVIDTATDSVVANPRVGVTSNPGPYSATLRADGSQAYVGLFNEGSAQGSGVYVLDLNTFQQTSVITVSPGVVRPWGG
jgi:DNA-binding beta-propeller fold protein YncE